MVAIRFIQSFLIDVKTSSRCMIFFTTDIYQESSIVEKGA